MELFLIIREMFESDSGWFLLIGFGLAFLAGMLIAKKRTRSICLCLSAVYYLLCEAAADFDLVRGMAKAFFVLLTGTAALGAAVGFGVSALIKYKNENEGKDTEI